MSDADRELGKQHTFSGLRNAIIKKHSHLVLNENVTDETG